MLEQHVGVEARPGATSAEPFDDTVGVGSYRIDLHPSTAGRGYLDIATYPFQIPLGALVPQRIENLLASGKSLGVTHITNGCYRLHPVEWNVGEAAGALAAFCLERRTGPRCGSAGRLPRRSQRRRRPPRAHPERGRSGTWPSSDQPDHQRERRLQRTSGSRTPRWSAAAAPAARG